MLVRVSTTAEETRWFSSGPQAPGRARRLLSGLLAGVPGSGPYVDTGLLLISELVTNAVEHAPVPGRLLMVRVQLRDGALRIEVHDPSGVRPLPRTAGPDAESGRGLLLVRSLAAGWGCCPRAGGAGKIVWCTVVPPAGGGA
ncbi:ATP-binding protein [Kitasatospora sp. NBC_00315]|uniref:ATP-binding protein n=1 Tax=Kitasatospora sp. NBC_00315 TaxID=2975963 RepID=UPI0032474423